MSIKDEIPVLSTSPIEGFHSAQETRKTRQQIREWEKSLGVGLSEAELAQKFKDAGLPYNDLTRAIWDLKESGRLEDLARQEREEYLARDERWRQEDKDWETKLIQKAFAREDTAISRKVGDAISAGLSPHAVLGGGIPTANLGARRLSSGGSRGGSSGRGGFAPSPNFDESDLFALLLMNLVGGLGRGMGRGMF